MTAPTTERPAAVTLNTPPTLAEFLDDRARRPALIALDIASAVTPTAVPAVAPEVVPSFGASAPAAVPEPSDLRPAAPSQPGPTAEAPTAEALTAEALTAEALAKQPEDLSAFLIDYVDRLRAPQPAHTASALAQRARTASVLAQRADAVSALTQRAAAAPMLAQLTPAPEAEADSTESELDQIMLVVREILQNSEQIAAGNGTAPMARRRIAVLVAELEALVDGKATA